MEFIFRFRPNCIKKKIDIGVLEINLFEVGRIACEYKICVKPIRKRGTYNFKEL